MQFPACGAVGDQLVEVGVQFENFEDGHAAPVALVIALVAADRAIYRRRTIRPHSQHAAFARVRLIGLPAMLEEPSDQALRDYADDIAGENVRDDSDVEKARNGSYGGIGVQGRVDLVARHRRSERHGRRVLVANLAHQDDVGVLPHERADAVAEVHLRRLVHRSLADQGHRIFDRILQGHDVEAVVVDVVEHRIERGRLAAAGRACHQDDALGSRDHLLEKLELARFETQTVERHDPFLSVENAQYDVLAVRSRLGGDAKIDGASGEHQGDASVLRRARFGDVHFRHDFDTDRHRRPVGLVQRADLAQHAVDAVADAQEALLGLEVNVGCAPLDRVREQRGNEAHHGLRIRVARRLKALVVDLPGLDLMQNPVDREIVTVVLVDCSADLAFARESGLERELAAQLRAQLVEGNDIVRVGSRLSSGRYVFCGTFLTPKPCVVRVPGQSVLRTTLPCGARTFLPS